MPETKRRGRPPKTKAERTREKKLAELADKPLLKMTKQELIKYTEDLEGRYKKLEESAFCYICGKHKPKVEFYKSTDPLCKSGVAPVCKDCAKGIARRRDRNGDDHSPTKDSVKLALFYLNKPYLDSLWDSSVEESNNANNATGKNPDKYDVYAAYIKNVAMPQYVGKTWRDSEVAKEKIIYEDEKTVESLLDGREDQDAYVDYLKNKEDVKRLLSYDPFEKESLDDQPFLYSQLLGLLDSSEDANDDMLRTASAISIVRGFLQQSKIDDAIARLMMDPKGFDKNSATIKSLQDSKSKITGIIKDLAAESCISLKNSKVSKKGENTWTGKLKKIRDLNLREGEVNGFDLNTCRGMRQVMDMSNESLIRALKLDESEYADMIAEQRQLVTKYYNDALNYKEVSRILLRENLDLKDVLEYHGIEIKNGLVDLNELFSPFSSAEEDGDEDD